MKQFFGYFRCRLRGISVLYRSTTFGIGVSSVVVFRKWGKGLPEAVVALAAEQLADIEVACMVEMVELEWSVFSFSSLKPLSQ